MRNRLCKLAFAWACVVAPAPAPGEPVPGVEPQVHDDWESVAATHGRETRFRATTSYVSEDLAFMLISDRIPPDCHVEFLSINFSGLRAFDRDLVAGPMNGELRIDQFPQRHFAFALSARMGDSIGVLTIVEWSTSKGLHRELHAGTAIRFRLQFADDDYEVNFSLRGFGAATDRTEALCKAFGRDVRRDGAPPAGEEPNSPGTIRF